MRRPLVKPCGMAPTLAHLKETSPLCAIFKDRLVPLLSAVPIMIQTPAHSKIAAYLANPRAFTPAQLEGIARYMVAQGQGSLADAADALLHNEEMPLLAEHVSGVSFDGRLVS